METTTDCRATLIICTYKRAASLGETLSKIAGQVDLPECWQLLVVDNAGDPDTQRVADSFSDRLPVEVLVENRPGQNVARNAALPHVRGDLVIFTDDDTSPDENWIATLLSHAEQYPDHDIFGGKIVPVYPGEERPAVADAWFANFAFADQDLGDEIRDYPPNAYPSSPNMAIRREVFDAGNLFDESIGPIGTRRVSGSEAEFFSRVTKEYRALYVPAAVVEHRISEKMLEPAYLRSRCYAMGLGMAVWAANPENEIYLRRIAGIPRYHFVILVGALIKYISKKILRDHVAAVSHICRVAFEVGYIKGRLGWSGGPSGKSAA